MSFRTVLEEPVRPAVGVHYRIDGRRDGPTVVLSHALGLSMAMWDPQLPRLSRDFRVLRYDHRGHGSSPVPRGPYTFSELGRDLLTLLDRLEIDRVSFCGLSLGGMVGIWVAVNAPDRIERLVLCCTAARMMRPADYAERALQVRALGIASIAEAVIGRWFTPTFAASRPDTVGAIRAVLESTPAEGYAATCEALAGMDQRDDLSRIAVPTTVIAAEHDESTPPQQAREMAGKIRGARFALIPGASHIANIEQPEAVTDQILEQLA